VDAAGLEDVERTHDVGAIVRPGLRHRLANEREGSEVQHADRPVSGEYLVQAGRVEDIAAFDRPPAHGPSVTDRKVVIGDRQVSGGGKCLAGMAADKSGPARHDDRSPVRLAAHVFTP
jgi:hypothetical protein